MGYPSAESTQVKKHDFNELRRTLSTLLCPWSDWFLVNQAGHGFSPGNPPGITWHSPRLDLTGEEAIVFVQDVL